jgi:hypothetical protein
MHDFVRKEVGAAREQRYHDPELARFNARIGLFISGEIEPMGDKLMRDSQDDEPDGGELARLIPLGVPPHLSSVALRPPEREPLVDLQAV